MLSNNQSKGGNKTFVQLRAKASDGATPGFYQQVKPEGADKWRDGDHFSTIDPCSLVSIKRDEYNDPTHGEIRKVVMEFTNGEDTVQLEANMSTLTRGIINSLATAELNALSLISLEVWKDEKSGYAKSKVLENGNTLDWAVEWDDQPRPVETPLPNGKVHKDYTNVDEFFYGLVDKIQQKLIVVDDITGNISVQPEPKAVTVEDSDDDLPF